ncbi:Ribophorin I [Cokeromyces recurvatus]|uniref:Ribophorin I n=1 Tax=Cokeromyces recurvatus TaxID=90255 RepID=UPI00221FB6B6|nr:Ribophorin I [Cokeromyces recurvatus]KAI7904226.1 Ribophorin I [Cokeromyces recurvatus]
MKSLHFILQLLFALCCFNSIIFAFPHQFENAKVLRVIDINNAIAREEVGIRARNVDNKVAQDYYFYLPSFVAQKSATISAFLKKEKTPLKLDFYKLDEQSDLNVYKIHLDKPVQPQQDVLIGIKIAYTHLIKPMPAKLPQVARQHTSFAFNTYLISPYTTKETKTTLQTPSKNIISHTGGQGKTTVNNNKIVYGPYTNISPMSFDLATCHFENTKPLLTVTSLKRDIEVSHWSQNLAVEEHYALRNDGAQLEQSFSRIQYQMSSHIHDQTNVLKGLSFDLPVSARDVYFRDEVGNVSTSHFRVQNDKALLEIQPRYPLFGGWNYTWYHGYNADLASYVHSDKGKYMLKVNFVENVKNMVIDKATVRVILPEGSSHIKVTTPFDVDSESTTFYFTYFDSTGRTMVVLEKNNVIKDHELPILIEYEYTTSRLLQKPLVTSFAIFLLFVISIIIGKMSFTIGKEEKSALKKE